MNLPFYFSTTIISNLSADEIKGLILEHTVTAGLSTVKDQKIVAINRQIYNDTRKSHLYKASFNGMEFRMQRILTASREGNAFNPWCFGRISQVTGGSDIRLRLRPALFVLIFVYIAMLMVAEGFFAIFLSEVYKRYFSGALITILVFVLPVAMFYFFYRWGFKREIDRTVEFLRSIINKDGESLKS